jgi:hypothetical protein
MRIRSRLERLVRRAPCAPPPERAAEVEVWLPRKLGDDTGCGRHRLPGSAAVLVLYEPETPIRERKTG